MTSSAVWLMPQCLAPLHVTVIRAFCEKESESEARRTAMRRSTCSRKAWAKQSLDHVFTLPLSIVAGTRKASPTSGLGQVKLCVVQHGATYQPLTQADAVSSAIRQAMPGCWAMDENRE